MLLNCSCCGAEMDGNKIESVSGFQLTTYTWHHVKAKIFIDCSGDSILAPLTGAEYRMGRESKDEFQEEFGVERADSQTMGMSLLLQARETDHPVSFTPPPWAYTFKTDDEMMNKPHNLRAINTNFYWVELGGRQDGISDTEEIRDELLKIAFGAWDHMKNWGDHGAENWELEWVGFLPEEGEPEICWRLYPDPERCGAASSISGHHSIWWLADRRSPAGRIFNGCERRTASTQASPVRALWDTIPLLIFRQYFKSDVCRS